MVTRQRAIEILNDLPTQARRYELIKELDKAAQASNQDLGDFLADLLSARPTNHNPKPAKTMARQTLGPELKAMYDSGCEFEKSNSPQGMKLFCSEQGMIWDKTWSELSEGQQKKFNVARGYYWDWCKENGVVPWTAE